VLNPLLIFNQYYTSIRFFVCGFMSFVQYEVGGRKQKLGVRIRPVVIPEAIAVTRSVLL